METETAYIGVDPGVSGGLAAITAAGITAVPMPQTERDIWDWFLFVDIGFACVEQVSGYVGDAGNPGSAMFKFGTSYGGLRMALTAAMIPFDAVTPGVWQKALGISKRGKGEARVSWKNRLKARAQQLFPQIKVTLATADALLIAEFCRRKQQTIKGIDLAAIAQTGNGAAGPIP